MDLIKKELIGVERVQAGMGYDMGVSFFCEEAGRRAEAEEKWGREECEEPVI